MRTVGPLVALALAALAHPVRGDAKCKIKEGEDPANTVEFARCKAETDYVFSNPGGIDVTRFCSNSNCKVYWLAMEKNLQCFQYSASAGNNVLKDATKGLECFNRYMSASTPAPAPAPTSAPSSPSSPTVTAATPSTPSETTKAPSTPSAGVGGNAGTSDAGGNAGTNGASGTTSTSDSQSTTTTTKNKKSSASSGSGKTTSDDLEEEDTAGGGTDNTAKKTSTGSKGTDGGDAAAGSSGGTAKDESTTPGSGSATTGNNPSKKRKSTQSGSGSDGGPRGGGGGGGGGDDGEDPSSGSGTSSTYMVAGGAGGGIVVGIFVFMYFRKRADREANAKKMDPDVEGYLPTLQTSRSRASSADSLPVMGNTGFGTVAIQSKSGFWEDEAITAARIPFEKLKRGALISRGGYGEVYRGSYRGEQVAIKTLLRERRKDLRQIEKFLTEVKLMASLEHEHIVRFIGVAWDSLNELCVVSEFMAGGDLRSLLMTYAEDPAMYPNGFNPDKIKVAMHIAHALTYMHSLQPTVLHRDLKSRNILLDADLNAKLTDFGISRERVDSTMTIGVGSSLWIAPEVMTGGHYDEKADVFSFGVVLSELDTHRLPYAHAVETGSEGRKLPDTVIVQMMTTSRLAVQFSDEATSPMAKIGRRCVAVDPSERPTAAEVQHQIHQLSRGLLLST